MRGEEESEEKKQEDLRSEKRKSPSYASVVKSPLYEPSYASVSISGSDQGMEKGECGRIHRSTNRYSQSRNKTCLKPGNTPDVKNVHKRHLCGKTSKMKQETQKLFQSNPCFQLVEEQQLTMTYTNLKS